MEEVINPLLNLDKLRLKDKQKNKTFNEAFRQYSVSAARMWDDVNPAIFKDPPPLFYDTTIYEGCDLEELKQDSFIDPAYIDVYDLDDEEIFSWIRERLDGVDNAIDLKEPIIINGIPSTPYGIVSESCGKMVVTMGALNVKAVTMEIIPDFLPAKITMDWYFKFMDNPHTPFPYIPVADPVVPHVAKEQPASSDDLDEVMLRAGGLIFSPSYTFMSKHDSATYVSLEWENKTGMDMQVAERIIGKKFIHSSRSNWVWHWTDAYRVCALEFNPFHPMALPYIRTYEDDGCVIKGKYRWGRRERDFYFNRNSVSYRLHYEIWGGLFGYKNYYLSMFDLVGNFDLRELMLFSRPEKIYTFAPRYVVEGFFPKEIEPFFSSISSSRRNQLANEDYIMTYYSCLPVKIATKGQRYVDVTDMYELRYYNQSRWELFVASRASGKTVVTLIYTDKRNIQRQTDPSLFIQYTMQSAELKVYVLESQAPMDIMESDRPRSYFLYNEGCFFFGMPRNAEGSLIPHPSVITFSHYMKTVKLFPDKDVMLELMPDGGDTPMEELLSKEELEKLRVGMGHEYVCDVLDDDDLCNDW